MELPSLLSELLVLCVEGFFVRFLAFLLEILGASTSSFRLTAQLGNMMSPGEYWLFLTSALFLSYSVSGRQNLAHLMKTLVWYCLLDSCQQTVAEGLPHDHVHR